MNKLIYILTVLLIAGTGKVYTQTIGNPAPEFEVNLLEPDSATFSLSAQEGKVVFVYLFGNGCPYCISSAPEIESSIFQVFKDNSDFAAIGIDTWNTSSNKTSVTAFRERTGITFPLAIKAGFVATEYQTTYDRLMVIDKNGILVHNGIIVAKNDVNNTLDAINQSLGVTGLDLLSDSQRLNVYPNPASDVLHISTEGNSLSGFSLYDVTGKVVHSSQLSGYTESSIIDVPLQQLEQGIYFYSIVSEGSLFTGKLLIQRSK